MSDSENEGPKRALIIEDKDKSSFLAQYEAERKNLLSDLWKKEKSPKHNDLSETYSYDASERHNFYGSIKLARDASVKDPLIKLDMVSLILILTTVFLISLVFPSYSNSTS